MSIFDLEQTLRNRAAYSKDVLKNKTFFLHTARRDPRRAIFIGTGLSEEHATPGASAAAPRCLEGREEALEAPCKGRDAATNPAQEQKFSGPKSKAAEVDSRPLLFRRPKPA